MKTLLSRCDCRKEATRLIGQHPDPRHADDFFDSDVEIVSAEGVVAVLLCGRIPSLDHKIAFQLWSPFVNDWPSNRPAAMGTPSLPRSQNMFGEFSPRCGVPESILKLNPARQGELSFHRNPLRWSRLTTQHPEILIGARRMFELMNQLYKEHAPAVYARQRAAVRSEPQFRLWHTVFSSVYLARNFRTAYHRDANNLRGVFTALTPTGQYTGGELVLPRWRVGFALQPGDLLLFDPQQVHGNLPIHGERISAAAYCARGIVAKPIIFTGRPGLLKVGEHFG